LVIQYREVINTNQGRSIVNMISGGTNRIVAIWSSLSDYVADVHSVNVFRNSLDRHWCTRMQEVFYDYESELSGIGNRSFD